MGMSLWKCGLGHYRKTQQWIAINTNCLGVGSWRVIWNAWLFVNPFGLSICLQVISHGSCYWDPQKADSETGWILIQIAFLDHRSPLLVDHGFSIHDPGITGLLQQLWVWMWLVCNELIYTGSLLLTWWHHSLCLEQFCYQINQDDLPAMIRDLVGLSLPVGHTGKVFCAVSKVTAFHVIHHIAAHPFPKFTHDEFCHLPSSRVSSYQIVMVRIDDVEPELIVSGDVDLSSLKY